MQCPLCNDTITLNDKYDGHQHLLKEDTNLVVIVAYFPNDKTKVWIVVYGDEHVFDLNGLVSFTSERSEKLLLLK
jgi:hypothetical protein